MNPRFALLNRKRAVLILAVLIFIGVTIWFFPKVSGFYFQVKGGTILESAYTAGSTDRFFACDAQHLKINQDLVTKAIAYLEKAVQLNPRLSQANLLLGQGYCLSGQLSKARETFLRYIKQRPANPLGYLEMGFVYASKGNPSAARQVWSQAGINSSDLIAAGKQVSKSSPSEARLWFERALWLDPRSALAWISLGRIYTQEGLHDKALSAYEQAMEFNPELGTQPLVDLLISQGLNQRADAALHEALSQFPDSIFRREWWITLGSSLESQGKWNDALQVYKDAVVDFPTDAQLRIKLGWAYVYSNDDISAARETFLQAIDLDKSSGEGYAALGQLSSKEGNYQEADAWFRQAIAKSPNSYWYRLYQANNLRDSGELETAIQIYQQIGAQFPDYPSTFFNLAWAYRKEQNKDLAMQAIDKYASLLTNPTETNYARMADFYEWAGDYLKALDAYQNALAMNPGNLFYSEKISSLSLRISFDKTGNQNEP